MGLKEVKFENPKRVIRSRIPRKTDKTMAKRIRTKGHLNILTNWTTTLCVYSVLIPKDFVGSSLIGQIKILTLN